MSRLVFIGQVHTVSLWLLKFYFFYVNKILADIICSSSGWLNLFVLKKAKIKHLIRKNKLFTSNEQKFHSCVLTEYDYQRVIQIINFCVIFLKAWSTSDIFVCGKGNFHKEKMFLILSNFKKDMFHFLHSLGGPD